MIQPVTEAFLDGITRQYSSFSNVHIYSSFQKSVKISLYDSNKLLVIDSITIFIIPLIKNKNMQIRFLLGANNSNLNDFKF